MTRGIEEVIDHINKRIDMLEHELERMEEIRRGITEGRGIIPVPESLLNLERRAA